MKRAQGIEGALKQLRVTTPVTLDTRILDEACTVLDQAVSRQGRLVPGPWYERGPRRFVRVAAGLALAAAVVLVAIVLWNHVTDEPRQIVKQPKPAPGPNTPANAPDLDRQLAAERTDIETMVAALDIGGLVTMLEAGRPESKRLAAACLGEIGDDRAIPALSRLASQWQGDPAENPFTRAIEQINSKEQDAEPNVPNADLEPRGLLVPETRSVAVLSGTITDVDTGQPIEGVEIRASPRGADLFTTATSDSNGVYAFDSVGKDGPYNICLVAPDHIVPAKWRIPGEAIDLRRGAGATRSYALKAGAKVVLAVVDERGRSIPDVRFDAAYVAEGMGGGPQAPVYSDAGGTAVIGGLPPTEYLITAAHRDYALAGQKALLEDPQQIETVTFTLHRGMDIVGVATCSDDLPASGWEIEAKPKWWPSDYRAHDYAIAEDGTFVLEHILPGDYQLGIQIPGEDRSRGICTIDANLPPQTDVFDLRIPKPSPHGRVSLSGTVRFTGGDSEKGFWVEWHEDKG